MPPKDKQEMPRKGILKQSRRRRNLQDVSSSKKISFNQDNLTANRKNWVNAELEKWNKAHPDIESEYYAANERDRSKLLADYLRISMVDASDKTDEMGVRDQLVEQAKSGKTVDLMESIAKKVNGWETCKELLQKPELHKLITTNAPAADREKYMQESLANIEAHPKEKEFTQKIQQKNAADWEKSWNQRHPDIVEEYYNANLEKREDMIREYLIARMSQNGAKESIPELKALVSSPYNAMIVTKIAKKANHWDSCKEELDNPDLYKKVEDLKQDPHMNQAKQEETLFDYLATLDDIPSKPRELTLKESKGKIPRDLNTMKENTAKVDTFANNLKGSVDSVDFNLAGKGSKQFDDMKKSVSELRRFVKEDYQSDPRGNISPEQHKALLAKTKNAIEKVRGYLDYKDQQFQKDPARRNDPKRQKREQPRILKNIEMLQELEKFYFEQSLQLPGIRYRDTSGDEKKREDFNKLMDGQRTKLLKNLASRQVKERYGEKGISLFNDIDKAEAAKNKTATNSKQKIEMAAKPEQKAGPKM